MEIADNIIKIFSFLVLAIVIIGGAIFLLNYLAKKEKTKLSKKPPREIIKTPSGEFYKDQTQYLKVCTSCGYIGRTKTYVRGSFLIEIFLWLMMILPGFLYSLWRASTRKKACPQCSSNMIPVTSPMGKKLFEELSAKVLITFILSVFIVFSTFAEVLPQKIDSTKWKQIFKKYEVDEKAYRSERQPWDNWIPD